MIDCKACNLCSKGNGPVDARGPIDAAVMLVGEAPGYNENLEGRPFVGKAGQELEHRAWRVAGLDVNTFYITNVVKCWPGKGNPTPKPANIDACSHWLEEEITRVRPRVVVPMGGAAIRYFLGSVTVEAVHGRPQRLPGRDFILLPMYHPAAGMYQSANMVRFEEDLKVLKRVLDGENMDTMGGDDQFPHTNYILVEPGRDGQQLVDSLLWNSIPAIDTETLTDGSLYCISVSDIAGCGYVFFKDTFGIVKPFLESEKALFVMHNSLYDLAVLKKAGINVTGVAHDTMLMAYVLQLESQGLKALSGRYCGMTMTDYDDVVGPYQRTLSIRYLSQVLDHEWANPHSVEETVWDKRTNSLRTKLRKPHNIKQTVKRLLADVADKGANPVKRWQGIEESTRKPVEDVLGVMPIADVSCVPVDDLVRYAARDADATIRLYNTLAPMMDEQGVWDVYRKVDLPALPMVQAMMEHGMLIDLDAIAILGEKFNNEIANCTKLTYEAAGKAFNINSPDQVASVLYDDLGLESHGTTGGGKRSTDVDALTALVDKHPVVAHILTVKQYEKLVGTYVEGLPRFADECGRVHAGIKTTRTDTGRLACADPNLQNQPVRSEEGKQIRDCFVAPEGYKLLAIDLSQIELRVMAHMSGDENMIAGFLRGDDFHTATAAAMFKVPLDWVTPEQRRPAKTVSFLVTYGGGPGQLLRVLKQEAPDMNWTWGLCEQYIRQWLDTYPGVRQYMRDQETFVRRHGYVVDMFGRRRNLPDIYSRDEYAVREAVKQAINTPIQGTAAGIIKVQMARVWEGIHNLHLEHVVYPLMQIHDELLFEVRDDFVDLTSRLVRAIMEQAAELRVPVVAEVKVGQRWGSLEAKYAV